MREKIEINFVENEYTDGECEIFNGGVSLGRYADIDYEIQDASAVITLLCAMRENEIVDLVFDAKCEKAWPELKK